MADTTNIAALSAPPMRSPLLNPDGTISQPWASWLNAVYARLGNAIAPSNANLNTQIAALNTEYTGTASAVSTLESQMSSVQAFDTALSVAVPLPQYLKANVPAASSHAWQMILVTNASAGAGPYISNGTNWIAMSTGAVLS